MQMQQLLQPQALLPQPRIKGLAIAFLVIAAIGFADATWLTAKHFLGGPLPCLTGGCELVTTSAYSNILGIPVALLGAGYYLTQLILAIAYFESKSLTPLRLASYLATAGLLASIYFVSLQLFVLHAICIYCMVSAGTSTTLFILGLLLLRHLRKQVA